MQFLPYLSIRPSYLSLYSLPETKKVRSDLQMLHMQNLKHNSPEGDISVKAEKRIRNAIDWLLEITPKKPFYAAKWGRWYKFRINFVTITLASKQVHSDQVIKKELLNQFLIECKKKWHVKNYLWRAEAQKNGNIHFHICTDRFIPWLELRNTWNRIQNKLGYVDRFHVKHKHRSPNSTDVHSIKRIKNISAYLAKYCTKQSPHRSISGKLWGLSTQLSRLKSNIQLVCSNLATEVEYLCTKFNDKLMKFDYVDVLYCKSSQWFKHNVPTLKRLHEEFIMQSRAGPVIAVD